MSSFGLSIEKQKLNGHKRAFPSSESNEINHNQITRSLCGIHHIRCPAEEDILPHYERIFTDSSMVDRFSWLCSECIHPYTAMDGFGE